MKKFKEDIYQIRFAIIFLTIYTIITQIFFGTICPFSILFNIECPGCGMTRSTVELLKGNFDGFIENNFMCIYWILLFILFIIHRYFNKISKETIDGFFLITCVLTIVRYFLNIFL